MKIGGYIIVDGHEVAETVQCCHCGNHFPYRKGSGTRRGFCTGCDAITCGSKDCYEHVAFEKKIELYEKGFLTTL